MKVKLPKGQYIKKFEINTDHIDIQYAKKKKVALCFISVNDRYWPYLQQVIEDCQLNFLPQHQVDYFVWSDIPEIGSPEHAKIAGSQWWTREKLLSIVDWLRGSKNIEIFPTEAIEWPAPTLMRYHLFLQQEDKLKDYDYVFYLDADMRVVEKISDEILNEGLLAAEHPMYSLRKEYIPPYEPNPASAAYIPRPGQVVTDDQGQQRFKPYYYAGGFQGGKTKPWIKAMKAMRSGIDKDFNKNYVAIWNDESHWNKYLSTFTGPLTVLSPSYIYPDSLIKEYYEPIWGKSYPPKIITITKPFSLSKDAAVQLNQFLGNKAPPPPGALFECPTCQDKFDPPGFKVLRVVSCPGSNKPHQLDMQKL